MSNGLPATLDGSKREYVEIDVQPGGPGNPWQWLGCVMSDAITVPRRSLTRKEGPDPAGGYKFAGFVEGEQGNTTLSLTIRRNRRNALKSLLNCPFGIRGRYRCTGPRDDVHNWVSLEGICNTMITEIGRSGWAVMESAENDDYVTVPVSLEGGEWWEYASRLYAERVAATLVAADINQIKYIDTPTCGECDRLPSDGCQLWAAVTDAGVGTYNEPVYIVFDGTQPAGSEYTTYEISPFQTGDDAVDFVKWGDIVVVISPVGGFARSVDAGVTWTAVTVTGADTHAPRALYGQGRQMWAVGDDGYIWASEDAGATWTVEDAGVITSENLADIAGDGDRVIVAVGANNAVVRSLNAGRVWNLVTGPSAGDDLTVVGVPRTGEVFIGNDVGELWRALQSGSATWTLLETFGGGADPIVSLAFCHACDGLFVYLVHKPAAGGATVWRAVDGGIEWRAAASNTLPTASLNAIACCEHSTATAVGDIVSTYGSVVAFTAEEE